jgi:hypothetical protein
MGRREIWSDPQIQKFASEYVCVIEETFFLYPDWLKDPPNPAATRLFSRYVANSPTGLFPKGTSTYQGLYCMDSDGKYLSGKFARQTREEAGKVLQEGLTIWAKQVAKTGVKPSKVPTNRLAMYGGEEIRAGGLKLEVVYRDLPRGEVRRPGNAQFPNPYNMGWFDFSPSEAKTLVTGKREKVAVPDTVFRKLATSRFKDAVRGQMKDWKKGDLKKGTLMVRMVSSNGGKQVYELSGDALLKDGDLSYAPRLSGTFTFDTRSKEFLDFKMIAAGQRTGKGAANGRATDLGPAPMGISFKLYQP